MSSDRILRKRIFENCIDKGWEPEVVKTLLYLTEEPSAMNDFIKFVESGKYSEDINLRLQLVADSEAKDLAYNFLHYYIHELLPEDVCINILMNFDSYPISGYPNKLILDNFFIKLREAYLTYDKFTIGDIKYLCVLQDYKEYYLCVYDTRISDKDIDYIFSITDSGRMLNYPDLLTVLMKHYKSIKSSRYGKYKYIMPGIVKILPYAQNKTELVQLYFEFVDSNGMSSYKYIEPLLLGRHYLYYTDIINTFIMLIKGDTDKDKYISFVKLTGLYKGIEELAVGRRRDVKRIVNKMIDLGYKDILDEDPSRYIRIIENLTPYHVIKLLK